VVDQLVVTDGAGGLSFSAPALSYYGLQRSRVTGRELSRLRRSELLRAGRIIGIRNHYFLDQKDSGFTLDIEDGLRNWDLPRVRRELRRLLDRERYDVVLTLLPTSHTHGHHKTVALLALEAVQSLSTGQRPVLMGVSTGSDETVAAFEELDGYPETRTTSGEPVWSFDRRAPLTLSAALDHSIIVNWVIAEHKSQGMFQMEFGRHTHEHFWQFSASGQCDDAVRHPLLRHFAAGSLLPQLEAA
jgi:LmbE family N-acetylglucosaminyl deacetylase